MVRNLIVTVNAYDKFQFNSQPIESMRNAASRWGADFYEKTYFEHETLPGPRFIWAKYWCLSNFAKYDNVLYLDYDTIINERSPSIFEEIDDMNSLYAVIDGNPGRFEDDFFKKNNVPVFATKRNAVEVFTKNIKNFTIEKYLENYFNTGVMLYKPKQFKPIFDEFLRFIQNNSGILEYLNNQGCDQDLINAWFSSNNIPVKYLDNKWNWIAPDIDIEYNENMFLGDMIPNIYHFCGTNLSKERLHTYDRWKI